VKFIHNIRVFAPQYKTLSVFTSFRIGSDHLHR